MLRDYSVLPKIDVWLGVCPPNVLDIVSDDSLVSWMKSSIAFNKKKKKKRCFYFVSMSSDRIVVVAILIVILGKCCLDAWLLLVTFTTFMCISRISAYYSIYSSYRLIEKAHKNSEAYINMILQLTQRYKQAVCLEAEILKYLY